MKARIFFVLLMTTFFFSSTYSLTGTEIFNKVSKSVVLVFILKEKEASKKNLISQGSAVAVQHDIVATNCHVAQSGKYILIIKDNAHSYASLIEANKSQDICLLKVHDMTLVPVAIRPTDDIALGDEVYAIGNPGYTNYLSKGIISKIYKNNENTWIFTDTTTAPGSSGGGLFDTEGNLIAITAGGSKDNPNISISASTDWIIQKLNIQPHYKNSSPNTNLSSPEKKTPPSEKASNNPHGLQLLGTYGDSHVALYQHPKGCFIYFPGRTVSGLITSSALWFPEKRQLIFIYPDAKSVNHVLETHLANENKNPTDVEKIKKTNHKLSLYKKYYQLYSHVNYGFNESILLMAFEKDPTMILAEGDKFIIYINDPTVTGGYRIRIFGLWGFSEALVDYNAKCLNKPSP